MSRTHKTEHTITVHAPAKTVYELISDVTRWPYTFGPTVHAEKQKLDEHEERLRIWAFANGEVRNWTSRRTFDPAALRVRFRQEKSSAPVETMGGEWQLVPLSDDSTWVVLLHDFRTVDDNPEHTEWIKQATDRNSESELSALKHAAELGERYGDLVLSFEDSVSIDSPPAPVYDFLYRADLWPQRLPHVAALDLVETVPNQQSMKMDTRSPDGSIHTTHSVRVCFPSSSIVYKQTATPPIMAAHIGRWSITPTVSGVRVTSHHTVVIRPEEITKALGPDATLDEARAKIRHALGTNSTTTMTHAKQAAESRD